MRSELRHLAVHVHDPKVGDFRWVLIELAEDHTWREIETGQEGVATYKQAMADGLVALQALVSNLNEGPRRTAAREHTRELARQKKSDGRGQKNAANEDGSAIAEKRSVLGFGLAN